MSHGTAELPELTSRERSVLLIEARRAVEAALRTGEEIAVSGEDWPATLREPWATFVTLHLDGDLRGCIGSTMATRPLVEDVLHHAFAAALLDQRFAPLTGDDVPAVAIQISILSDLVPIPCRNEAELLRQLRPGRDGLLIDDGEHRATFLPVMWQQLPAPRSFLHHLQEKAGLFPGRWPENLRAFRYSVASIE